MERAHHSGSCAVGRTQSALGWIAVLAASISIAYAMNSALTGSSVNPDGRRVIVASPASTEMPLFDHRTPAGDARAQGPSCTWIGAYCAFPDQ
jgi:hypothetical protein